MALIIYPTDSWDSFLDVSTCETLSDAYISGNKFSQLTDEPQKEAVLRQTALQIKTCKSIVLPEFIEVELQLAQMYLVEQALTLDMIAYDPNDKAITGESVDTISVSYDTSKKGSNGDFTPMVNSLLSQYGCTRASGGFSQVSVGRS